MINSKDKNSNMNLYDTKDSTKSSDEDNSRILYLPKREEAAKIRIKKKSIISPRRLVQREDEKAQVVTEGRPLANFKTGINKIKQKQLECSSNKRYNPVMKQPRQGRNNITTAISPVKCDRDNRLLSLSPTVYDRSKVAKLMKKYAFVRPKIHRYRSPEVQNKTFCFENKADDARKHHFDLAEIKKKLFSQKTKRGRPKKSFLSDFEAKLKPRTKESDISTLFMESPFPVVKAKPQGKGKILNISDKEIETIRNQIWTNMNQKKKAHSYL